MADTVETTIQAGIFTIRLRRPARHNALDEGMIEGLHAAVERARREKAARAVLLSGEGRSFCAGADIDWMLRMGKASPAENERSALRLAALFEALDALELPVVARIQGAAVGGGVGLVAVSDVAVASASATFSLAEVRLGIVPAVICPHVLAKVGAGQARDLMLTGRRIGAAEALRLGLIHRVADDAALDAAAGEVLEDILKGGPGAQARVKRLIRDVPGLEKDRDALARRTAREIAEARAGEEGRAGFAAFLEKKPPPWALPRGP